MKAHNARELMKRRRSSSESSRGCLLLGLDISRELGGILFCFAPRADLPLADAILGCLAVLQIPAEAGRNPRRGIMYNYPARESLSVLWRN